MQDVPADETPQSPTSRSLTVIAFTDLVGYSAMTESDEALALELLDVHRRLVRERLAGSGGLEIKTIGDAFLLEFPSALSAVRCLVGIQAAHAAYNRSVTPERAIRMRAGIHLGDVERRDGDIFGSGVNIAARIEPLAPVGGIAISEQLHFQVRQSTEATFLSIGRPALKNIGADMEVFVWAEDPAELAAHRQRQAPVAPAGGLRGFLHELRRRRVIHTLLLYVGAAWLLQQAAGVLVPMFSLPSWVLPGVSVLLFAGFPVVMYLSWLFDITPQGVKRTGTDARAASMRPALASVLGLLVIVLGSGAMGYQLFIQLASESAKRAEGLAAVAVARGASIAVMPFKDQSPDQDQSYFAEGLAEELTSLLGTLPGLEVAASSSTFELAGQGLAAADAGRRLGVGAVLDGSVRIAGDRMKVRVELVNPADGKTLWTESFSRPLADVFDVEAEIGRSIVNLLQDNYLEAGAVSARARTASTDAYVLYLKGREQYRRQTTEAMKEARKLFEEALGLDPEYALAYVGAADSLVLLSEGQSRLGVLDRHIAGRLAAENLAKALVRAPQLAEAYAVQGKVQELTGAGDDEALSAYDKAIALNPSLAIAHMWRYQALERLGRHRESMEALEKAHALDPVSVTTMYNRAWELSRRGRYAESRAQFDALVAAFPGSPMGPMGLADLAFRQGRLADSLEQWGKARALSPENRNFLQSYIGVLFALGLVEPARVLAQDPVYRANLLIVERNYEALFREMDFQVSASDPSEWMVAFEAGWYQSLYGSSDRAVGLLQQARANTPDTDLFAMPMCFPAIEYAWAAGRGTDEAAASALLQECRRRLDAARAGEIVDKQDTYLAARIAALGGDRVLAIEELTRAVDAGWREEWTARDPLLASLREDPAAARQFERIASLLEAERGQARALLQRTEATPPLTTR